MVWQKVLCSSSPGRFGRKKGAQKRHFQPGTMICLNFDNSIITKPFIQTAALLPL
jgi:hypothetical protein